MHGTPPISVRPLSPRQFVNDLLGSQAMARGAGIALHRPLEVHLQLTSGCNLDCYMCHEHLRPEVARRGRGMRFLDAGILERIEREVMPYSSRLHLGVGGEPMLAPQFLEVVERAHARNQRIHLTTNGTRIATERVAEVLARCVATIEVSVDGATPETYERVRAGASFARLVQNLELLDRHRAPFEPEERARLVLCMVLMASNAHELPRLVELAARVGAEGVSAWPVIPVTEEARADAFDLGAARPSLEAARERAKALGVSLDLPFERAGASHDPANERAEALRRLGELERRANGGTTNGARGPRHWCHMPTHALYVFWDGRVYPCANPEAHQGAALGDLTKESFDSIWNGRAFRNLRAGLASGDAPEVCRRCPILHRAAGPVAGAGAGSDLVGWFGERDLAPLHDGDAAHGWIEQVVANGLADESKRRFEEQVEYGRTLERRVRSLERLQPLEAERRQLLRHALTLETERWHLARHALALEDEREHLVRHTANLERILTRIAGRRLHRALSRVKDLFVPPRPKPPIAYVPPWVESGSREPGAPPAAIPDRPPPPEPQG